MTLPESSTSRSVASHYYGLDFYRFIAACGVMVFHFSSMAGYAKNPNLRFLVDFFFVLSGFVIMHSYMDLTRAGLGKFIVRRVARIFPLHLITLWVFILIGLARLHQTGEYNPRFEFREIPLHLLMIHAWGPGSLGTFNFVSWSISAEWFAYLLFPALLWLHKICGNRWTLLVLAAATGLGLSLFCDWTGSRSWTVWTNDGGAYRAMPSFIAGMAVRVLPLPRLPWPAVYLAGLGYVALFFSEAPGEAFVIAGFIFVALSVGCTSSGPFDWPRLKIFGDASYGIYMWHIAVGTVMFNILGKRFLPLEPALLMAVSIGLTLILSIFSYIYFEKPARDWMRTTLEPVLLRRRSVPTTP